MRCRSPSGTGRSIHWGTFGLRALSQPRLPPAPAPALDLGGAPSIGARCPRRSPLTRQKWGTRGTQGARVQPSCTDDAKPPVQSPGPSPNHRLDPPDGGSPIRKEMPRLWPCFGPKAGPFSWHCCEPFGHTGAMMPVQASHAPSQRRTQHVCRLQLRWNSPIRPTAQPEAYTNRQGSRAGVCLAIGKGRGG